MNARSTHGLRIASRAALGVLLCAILPIASQGASLDPRDLSTWKLPGADLYDVTMQGDLAWAVGYWGTVLHSSDGGATWVGQPTPTNAHLYAVSFADESHGWAVGAEGTVLRTADGGQSWQRQPISAQDAFGEVSPWQGPLFGVAAVSEREAWAVGDFGAIFHTDNGVDWTQLILPPEDFADDNIPDRIFNAVAFNDRTHGWITGEFGTTLRTSDGGLTWVGERRLEGAAEDVYLMGLAAANPELAVASGIGGVALRTSDGGATWALANLATRAGLFGSAFRGEHALVVGDRGVMFTSRDHGATWFEPTHPRLFHWLRGAAFGADGLALVVGEGGIVLRSTDHGETWQQSAQRRPTSP